MSRTKKQPYRKSRRFDKACRNHGRCNYCRDNRTHANDKRSEAAREKAIEVERLATLRDEAKEKLK